MTRLSLFALLLLPGLVPAPDDTTSAPVSRHVEIKGITLALPELEDLRLGPDSRGLTAGHWVGRLGEAHVEILLQLQPKMGIAEPQDMTDLARKRMRPASGDRSESYRFHTKELVPGRFGEFPYASVCIGEGPSRARVTEPERVMGDLFVLGGVHQRNLFAIEVYTGSELSEKDREKVLDFLRHGVEASGEPIDVSWSDEEARRRWEEFVTDADVIAGLQKPIRTEHYIIMTNASAGTLFARKMEEAYARIQQVFPFPDVEGMRLLPVFLFRSSSQYVEYCMNALGWSREDSAATKGHASRDYYATYYDAPGDPVHIHEATHQVFQNRLRLWGGGSWFQEGVAEYVSSSHNERKGFARRAARDGKYIPFRQMVQIGSLIKNGHLGAGASYLQAASVIELLRDGLDKKGDLFPLFLEEMGSAPAGNPVKIEGVFQSVYGLSTEDLEKEWVRYWQRR